MLPLQLSERNPDFLHVILLHLWAWGAARGFLPLGGPFDETLMRSCSSQSISHPRRVQPHAHSYSKRLKQRKRMGGSVRKRVCVWERERGSVGHEKSASILTYFHHSDYKESDWITAVLRLGSHVITMDLIKTPPYVLYIHSSTCAI